MTFLAEVHRYFGVPGLLSGGCLLLWILGTLAYAVVWRRWWMTGLLFAIAGLAWGAGIVNGWRLDRIEVDDSARIEAEAEARRARMAARVEARRAAAPDVRFAEDTLADTMDLAGVREIADPDEAALLDAAVPAYRRDGPRGRTRPEGGEDDGLRIDPDDADRLAEVRETRAVRTLPPDELVRAERMHALNRTLTRALVWITLLLAGVHYLRRVYAVDERVPPCPLPVWLLNAVTPSPPAIREIPPDALEGALADIVRRGETYLCIGLPAGGSECPQVPHCWRTLPVLDMADDDADGEDTAFWLEAFWYGRVALHVPEGSGGTRFVAALLPFLATRRKTRARTRRRAWIVWAAQEPIPANWLAYLARLAERMGISILLTHSPGSEHPLPERATPDAPASMSGIPGTTPASVSVARSVREANPRGEDPPHHAASDHPESPTADARIRTQCPSCGRALTLRATLRGRKIRCPDCKHAFRVPS